MSRPHLHIAAVLFVLHGTVSHAGLPESGGASFEACSMVASQYLTTVQLIERGLEPEILRETLPELTDEGARRIDALHEQVGEHGATETYSNIKSQYARCAQSVFDEHGEPEAQTREHHFYVCAGENKTRYEILLAAWMGGELESVQEQLQPPHQEVAEVIFRMHEQYGLDAVFNELTQDLKQCIQQAPDGRM